jgi:hypothetical protein
VRRFGWAALVLAATVVGAPAFAASETLPAAPPVTLLSSAIGEADDGSLVHVAVGDVADGALRADPAGAW